MTRYADAGVDIEAGDRAVELMKAHFVNEAACCKTFFDSSVILK